MTPQSLTSLCSFIPTLVFSSRMPRRVDDVVALSSACAPRASVSACMPARASVRISSCWRQSEVNFNRDNSGVPLDALELVHARDIAPQDLHVTTGYIFTTNCFLRFFIYLFLNPFNKKRHKIKLNE